MTWIVDTCVVIDLLENDPDFGLRSASLLEARLSEGLAICPVTQIELAPAFDGDLAEQKRFLSLSRMCQECLTTSSSSAPPPWTAPDVSELSHRPTCRPVKSGDLSRALRPPTFNV